METRTISGILPDHLGPPKRKRLFTPAKTSLF